MFGLGIIKGTLVGIGIGFLTGLAIKEIYKKQNKKKSINDIQEDEIETKSG